MATITREGDKQSNSFRLESIILETSSEIALDLLSVFLDMKISENLNGLMSGEITINHQDPLFERYDIGGKDNFITIKMKSTSNGKAEGKLFERKFRLYQYSTGHNPDTNNSVAKLLIKSIGEVNNKFKRVSKSYKNVGTDTIVRDMLKLIGYEDKELNIESTMYNRDIVIPNITPLQVIDYVKDHSVSGDTKAKGDSAFYFFESRDAINFVSRSNLINKEPVATYFVGIDGMKDEHNIGSKFVLDRGYNIVDQVETGAYGLTVVSTSLVDKSVTHTRVTPDAVQQTYSGMNSKRSTDVDYNAGNRFVMASEDQMYKFQNVAPGGNTIAVREVNKATMNERKAFMRIGADSNITVGDVLDIRYDGLTEVSKNSGKWLVSEIVHQIADSLWIMDLALVRDGIDVTLMDGKKPVKKEEIKK